MKKNNAPKRLCPFKKEVKRDYDPVTGRVNVREYFGACAGERCMAYAQPLSGIGRTAANARPICLRTNP